MLLGPVLANAGVVYDVAVRPVDANMELASPTAPSMTPVVTRYFVQDGKVRVGGPNAKTVYVFKDRTMYVIDTIGRNAHVLKHASLAQARAHYADTVKQLEDAVASAPPDERQDAQRKADDMRDASDRLRQPVVREFRVTVRFESVDGHACRVWEEREMDEKSLELCVAPAAAIPGGADILAGLKTLSQFRQGSTFAIRVDFGLSDWWSNIDTLNGVPLLIREYKYDSQVSEVMLSAMHPGIQNSSLFDVPDGYQVQEGPDFTQWFIR